MFSLWALRISRVSRKPAVRIRPVTAPVPVSRVLVATVVPWAKKSSSPRNSPRLRPKWAAALRITLYSPTEGSLGVDSSLKAWIAPAGSMTTPSVKVPPMSTPMRNFMRTQNTGGSPTCQQE